MWANAGRGMQKRCRGAKKNEFWTVLIIIYNHYYYVGEQAQRARPAGKSAGGGIGKDVIKQKMGYFFVNNFD